MGLEAITGAIVFAIVGQEAITGVLVSAMSDKEVVRSYFVWHGEFCAALVRCRDARCCVTRDEE